MPEKFEPQPEEEQPQEEKHFEAIPENPHIKRILEAAKRRREQDEILARPFSEQTLIDLRLTRDVLKERIGNVQIGYHELAEEIYNEAYKGEIKNQREELDRLNGDLAIVEGLIRKKESG